MSPKILILSAYYLPGYKAGGALRTVVNIVNRLGSDFDFWIIAKDRDFQDIRPFQGVNIDQWNEIGKAHVFYASRRYRTIWGLTHLIRNTPHNILYLNSYFDPNFVIPFVISNFLGSFRQNRIIIAPRGEFSEGALAIKKRKKMVYIRLAKLFCLYENFIWQASSHFEAQDIRRTIGEKAKKIVVAPDLTTASNQKRNRYTSTKKNARNPLKICFLSRITPKKNLGHALKLLCKVPVPVRFSIYGPIEDPEYWYHCKMLIDNLPDYVKAKYEKSVDNNRVIDVLSKHDLFLFPTLGENYGHVVFESMLAGTPVLISDQTPWRELEKLEVGWDFPLDNESAFVDAIRHTAAMSQADYLDLRDRVYRYALTILEDDRVLKSNRKLFNDALHH